MYRHSGSLLVVKGGEQSTLYTHEGTMFDKSPGIKIDIIGR